jgi:hypothetical protein
MNPPAFPVDDLPSPAASERNERLCRIIDQALRRQAAGNIRRKAPATGYRRNVIPRENRTLARGG